MKARMMLWCLAFFVAAPLLARDKTDVLVMKNGDRLTCEIKGLDGDTLSVNLDYILNTQSLDWSKVDHVESKQLFIVKTQDGLVYSGTLSTPATEGGRPIKIQVVDANTNVELEKKQIVYMDETASNVWSRFNGNIGLGISYSKGNQTTQYNLTSAVSYPRERWSLGASYNSNLASSTHDTPATRNQLTLNGQRLLRWNNWYYTGVASFLQSSTQGIQLQSSLGGGIGRYLVNNTNAQVAVIGGFAWQRINYHEAVLAATSQDVAAVLIGSTVNLSYFNKTTLSVQAYVLPAVSEAGRVQFNLNATYYVKFWKNINWNISLYGNWDNRPPPGFSGSDYGASSGVSWKFGNR